ncbi:ThuA domain-containing protein [Kribbella catacumbae]|uniref:ThuA domain-containing protein n=1 Tax=Kribbella catacumbae TaxID=460086 RepID=UPI000368354E|nr:ThuA domain-containing protein [Kribbella catacumbae]
MRTTVRQALCLLLGAVLALAALVVSAPAAQAHTFNVLVFSKTAGFRHDSIPAGIEMIKQLGAQHEFTVTATEDASTFTDAGLASYDVVVWLSTTGDVLNADQQAAFERYIRGGGGYAGIHAASDTEYDWPWYGDLVGAYFDSHPEQQTATVQVPDRGHLSTKDLPQRWSRFDEWYNYRDNPRGDVHVLATLDEKTYSPGAGAMGHDHPIAWCQNYQGGRAWYTGMGHTVESYADPAFRAHVLGGIKTASGHDPADCGASVTDNFDQVTLAKGAAVMGEPMGLAVLPDGGVLHTSRDGRVHYTAKAGQTSVAATLDVYAFREDGMQGIAIDPDFATNQWVYLFYSPKLNTPAGEVPHNSDDPASWDSYKGYNQVSRFRFTGGKLDLASEQKILQIPQDRGNCCHHGGDLDFDADGNLYVSTGDDTDPFESNGYSPIDDRVTRAPQFDARRSAGNTNDLRGKLLRIKVNADGTYTSPAGNLFPAGTDKTRPEIYAMGFRNPFRIDVDDKTGIVWVGDYGPDSGGPNKYGPGGQVEFTRVDAPGNFGWPFCTGTNTEAETYAERTFTSTYTASDPNKGDNDPVGAKFDCAGGPANSSRLNTGLAKLPPAKASWLKYDGGSMPELGSGSESPMGGPVYHFDPANPKPTKFPAYYDNQFFAYEFGRRWFKNISLDADGSPLAIDPFSAGLNLTQLIDAEFGPDGSLYILDYGTGFFNGDENSAVYRVDYVAGSRSPVAAASADKTSGLAPLTVKFSSDGSRDPDPGDTIASYAWDFDGNGSTDSTEANPSHAYTANGSYTARLTVSDSTGKTGVSAVEILVGNTAPVLSITQPPNGYVYTAGETIPYRVTVTDPDGQPVDCTKVSVTYALGHDGHTHGGDSKTGCTGTITTTADASHGTDDNIFGLLLAEYTDTPPSPDAPPVKGTAEIVLQPDHRQAEHFSEMSGVQVVADSNGAEGGARVGYLDNGDWIAFDPYNLKDVKGLMVRASSGGSGGTATLRVDSPTGPVVAAVDVPNTGDWGNYVELDPVAVTDPGGTRKLYLTVTGGFDLDAFTFLRTLPQECDTRPAPNDEFDGTALDKCRWSVVRPSTPNLRVADGALQIDAVAGDMYAGTNSAKNLVLQPAPAQGGFEAVTKVDIGGTDDHEQAGILLLGTGNNHVKANLINIPNQGWRMEFGQTINGTAVFDARLDRSGALPASVTDGVWVKLKSDGHTLTAYWSADGTNWQAFGRNRALNTLSEPRIGVAAFNGAGATAKFAFFHLTPTAATACTPTAPEAGYTALFDGSAQSLAGWRMAGPGGFAYAGCEIMSHGGLGLYWYQADSFRNYSLKLDWLLAGDDNSGVFVGFPDPGNDPWSAVAKGREIQIDATDDPDSTTGAVYNAQAADIAKRDAALKPPGQWNAYEIVVQGKRIRVYLNGVLINDYVETDPNRLRQPSYVGLQNHGNGDEVFFRNIRIKEVTPPSITVGGITDGASYGDSASVRPTFSATDDESGVDTVTAKLDGRALTSGTAVDLSLLPLGAHTLVVTATDKAGNTATATRSFTTTTSVADVRTLITRYRDAGRLAPDHARSLLDKLAAAETAIASKDERRALHLLTVFKGYAERKVVGATDRGVLVRDADALADQVRG